MSSGRVRDFEDLREEDTAPRFATWSLLVALAACAGFGVLALAPSASRGDAEKVDPLGELAERQKMAEPAAAAAKARTDKAKQLGVDEVTFPGMLSDGANPTTALAAVRARDPKAGGDVDKRPLAPLPPPPTDRLPVTPLPARNVLAATPVVTRPRDMLTRVAAEKGALSGASKADPGHEGQFQLQVSSFRTRDEADQFALELRGRGHRAYVTSAEVEGRGIWYRVRIGPFGTQAEAVKYRSDFESKERVVPFVVLPAKPKVDGQASAASRQAKRDAIKPSSRAAQLADDD